MNFERSLLYFFTIIILNSCSSEYAERLSIAKELKLELVQTMRDKEHLGETALEHIAELKEKISFHAKVSGNEDLFIKELEEK